MKVKVTIEMDYDKFMNKFGETEFYTFCAAITAMIVARSKDVAEPEFRMPEHLVRAFKEVETDINFKIMAERIREVV